MILMGDSAGGGLSLAVTEQLKADGIRLPDELILLSPWVDVSMENEQIPKYESRDPFLSIQPLLIAGMIYLFVTTVLSWAVRRLERRLKASD